MSQSDMLLKNAFNVMIEMENLTDKRFDKWNATITEIQTYFKPNINETEHFKRHEIECPCGCGLANMSMKTLELAELVRFRTGDKGVIVRSGCRCYDHNRKAGGAPESGHLPRDKDGNIIKDAEEAKLYGECNALDVMIPGQSTWNVGAHAVMAGFTGIGIGGNITHMDTRDKKIMSAAAIKRGFSYWGYLSEQDMPNGKPTLYGSAARAYRNTRFWAALKGME